MNHEWMYWWTNLILLASVTFILYMIDVGGYNEQSKSMNHLALDLGTGGNNPD